MKVTVRVGDETFSVEIDDVHARPVRARIGDQEFEVWPETPAVAAPPNGTPPASPPTTIVSRPAARSAAPGVGANSVLAPLPGVVVSIAVQPGDSVSAGQPLCVLEAMKMNNTIRAARAGRVAAVRVSVGQAVQHRAVLLEYEPA